MSKTNGPMLNDFERVTFGFILRLGQAAGLIKKAVDDYNDSIIGVSAERRKSLELERAPGEPGINLSDESLKPAERNDSAPGPEQVSEVEALKSALIAAQARAEKNEAARSMLEQELEAARGRVKELEADKDFARLSDIRSAESHLRERILTLEQELEAARGRIIELEVERNRLAAGRDYLEAELKYARAQVESWQRESKAFEQDMRLAEAERDLARGSITYAEYAERALAEIANRLASLADRLAGPPGGPQAGPAGEAEH